MRTSSFDRVLVDAPCSGLGVLRRRAEARWRIDPEAIPGLAELQLALVLAAATAVRAGGTLVYAVCTLTVTETRDVADAAVAATPGMVRARAARRAVAPVGARRSPPPAGRGDRRHVRPRAAPRPRVASIAS